MILTVYYIWLRRDFSQHRQSFSQRCHDFSQQIATKFYYSGFIVNSRIKSLQRSLVRTSAFILLILYSPSFAESRLDDFINTQKQFIFELYKNKRYFDCIAETQRLLSYEKDTPDRDELLYFIDACYYAGGQYKTVISMLKSNDNNRDRFTLENIILLSRAYFNIGYYDLSRDILFKPDYPDIEESGRDKLFINRAGILINNFDYKGILSEIENAGMYMDVFNKSFAMLDFKSDIEAYREIGLKSKWLSVSLSALLPGAGQVYSGRIMDGLLSFVSVAGSAFGAYYFYKNKDMPMAMTFASFSCLFYGGNIYGAWNSALHANKIVNKTFTDRIIRKYDLYYDPMDYMHTGIFE